MKKLLLNIFSDSFFMYKHFLHFNISKIIIFIVTIIYMIVLFIPLLLLFALILYILWFFNNQINFYLFLWNPYYMILWIIFMILWIIIYIIWYSWVQVLLNNLSLWYVKKEKLAFSKNYYFDFKLFYSYFKITLLIISMLLLPVLFWILGFFILIAIAWWIQDSFQIINNWILNWLSISLLFLTIISLIWFIYFSYKTAFTYVILVDKYNKTNKLKKALYYIKKSFNFTHWFKKFIKFLVVLFIMLIFVFPIYYVENYYSNKAWNIVKYVKYEAIVKNWWELKEKSLDYESLKLDYWNKSIKELSYDLKKYSNISMLFYILELLFVWWLYNLVLVSFYKHLKK